jgi:hypothetical protein
MRTDSATDDADLDITFYGGTYFRFEVWEVEWSFGSTSTFYGVKLWKLRFLTELIGT